MLGFSSLAQYPISAIAGIRLLWESDIITPETWTPHTAGSASWVPYSTTSVTWTAQTPSSTIWTPHNTTPATWTED
jgi:hypothetical protein